jgi:hypothetical protein
MANDRDNHEDGVSRRHALECLVCAGTGILWVSGGVPGSLSLLGRAEAAPALAQTKPTIPIIVKDTTSIYWQTVLAGARKAGQDFGVNVAELGAQSESDANGQISILENAVASNPAAIVIAPAHEVAPRSGPGYRSHLSHFRRHRRQLDVLNVERTRCTRYSAAERGSSRYPVCREPAITLSRKDWHSPANGAVV